MNEIQDISLRRINNGAHYHFMQFVRERLTGSTTLANHEAVKPLADAFIAAEQEEDRCLVQSQKSLLTDEIAAADAERDDIYSNFRLTLKGMRRAPDPTMAKDATELFQRLVDFRINPSMQLNRETALIGNLTEDFTTTYNQQVTRLGLTAYVQALATANRKVHELLGQRSDEQAVLVAGALRTARQATDEAYARLVKTVNALSVLGNAALCQTFINQVNEQIDYYKVHVIPQGAKKETPNTPPTPPPTAG